MLKVSLFLVSLWLVLLDLILPLFFPFPPFPNHHVLFSPKKMFPKSQLKLGEEMLLHIVPDGIEVVHNGESLGKLPSAFIGRSLCEAYLDADSVSPSARESMAQGLAEFAASA